MRSKFISFFEVFNFLKTCKISSRTNRRYSFERLLFAHLLANYIFHDYGDTQQKLCVVIKSFQTKWKQIFLKTILKFRWRWRKENCHRNRTSPSHERSARLRFSFLCDDTSFTHLFFSAKNIFRFFLRILLFSPHFIVRLSLRFRSCLVDHSMWLVCDHSIVVAFSFEYLFVSFARHFGCRRLWRHLFYFISTNISLCRI